MSSSRSAAPYLYADNIKCLLLLLAQVTYNQVQPLQINYLAS